MIDLLVHDIPNYDGKDFPVIDILLKMLKMRIS